MSNNEKKLLYFTNLIDSFKDFKRFGQNVPLLFGLVAEVVTDATELDTLGSDGVHSVVVALDQLVAMLGMKLSFF